MGRLRSCYALVCLSFLASAWAVPALADDASQVSEAAAGDFSLAALARLEAERGNGGADDATMPVTAGWDKESGFFIADTNKENFLLTIGGLFQGRYVYKARDTRGSTDPVGRDQSYFAVPRARVDFSGYVLDPNMTFRLELDGNTLDEGDGGMRMLDAYILYKAGEYFGENRDILAFGAGQFKPYFLRQELVYAGQLQMVDRSLTNEYFNISRQIGVWLQSDLNPLFLSAAITNGWASLNRSPSDVDQVPAFIGKIDLSILGADRGRYRESNVSGGDELQWTIGASFATDYDNGTSEADPTRRHKAYQFGIDTAFKWGILSLQAEYVGRWLDYPVNNPVVPGDGSANYCHGLYVQGGLFLIPGSLEVTGRVSTVWGTDGDRSGNGVEVGPGLNWYISQSHRVKLQTDLMFFDISGNLAPSSDNLDWDGATGYAFDSPYAGLRAGEQGFLWRVQVQLDF